MAGVGIRDWLGGRRRRTSSSAASADATEAHLVDFVTTRRGVEAYVEQPTAMAGASILLVAHDGEWTRRSVESERWARRFAEHHHLPCYEAAVMGYPQRMRDFNQRAKGRRRTSD